MYTKYQQNLNERLSSTQHMPSTTKISPPLTFLKRYKLIKQINDGKTVLRCAYSG